MSSSTPTPPHTDQQPRHGGLVCKAHRLISLNSRRVINKEEEEHGAGDGGVLTKQKIVPKSVNSSIPLPQINDKDTKLVMVVGEDSKCVLNGRDVDYSEKRNPHSTATDQRQGNGASDGSRRRQQVRARGRGRAPSSRAAREPPAQDRLQLRHVSRTGALSVAFLAMCGELSGDRTAGFEVGFNILSQRICT